MLEKFTELNGFNNVEDFVNFLSKESKLSPQFINDLSKNCEYNDLESFVDILSLYSDFDKSKITGKFQHFKEIFSEMIECEV